MPVWKVASCFGNTQEQIYIYDFRESSVFWCHCVARFTLQRWVSARKSNLFPHTRDASKNTRITYQHRGNCLRKSNARRWIIYNRGRHKKPQFNSLFNSIGIKIKPREDKTPMHPDCGILSKAALFSSTAGRPRKNSSLRAEQLASNDGLIFHACTEHAR